MFEIISKCRHNFLTLFITFKRKKNFLTKKKKKTLLVMSFVIYTYNFFFPSLKNFQIFHTLLLYLK